MSVRLRLTLLYGALTSVTLIISSILLYVVLYQTMMMETDTFLQSKARDLGASTQVIGGPAAYWVRLPDLDRFVESDVYAPILSQDGDILDEQMIRLVDGLNQGRELAVDMKDIDAMIAHRFVIVGLHRLGLAANHGNPLGIGLPRQLPNGRCVACFGPPQCHALKVPDLPPDLCTSLTSEITMPRSTDLHMS